ncbi:hypothetical protein SDC9_116820 [bioreactor metagenome]|uniref:Uncharacterized protein n=1 Tax=bioreactor metagenome TaxID=1076179 RepID=A0A645BX46_9ZZZZ
MNIDNSYHSIKGKDHISQNAFKLGLTAKKHIIMPCKVGCRFKDICNYYSLLNENKDPDDEYIHCYTELALYLYLKDRFKDIESYSETERLMIKEYIRYTILIERCIKYLSINPDFIYDDEASNVYVYFNRYENKVKKLLNSIRLILENK